MKATKQRRRMRSDSESAAAPSPQNPPQPGTPEQTPTPAQTPNSMQADDPTPKYNSTCYKGSKERKIPVIAMGRKGMPGQNDQVGSAQASSSRLGKEMLQSSTAMQVAEWIGQGHCREADCSELLAMGVGPDGQPGH